MSKISDNDKFEIKYVDPADHPKAFDGDRINLWDFDEPNNITVGEVTDYFEKEVTERMEAKIGATFRAGLIIGAIIATIAIIAGYNF